MLSGRRYIGGLEIHTDFHKIWREQCEATPTIRERFGVKSALDYLVGEKLADSGQWCGCAVPAGIEVVYCAFPREHPHLATART